VSAAHRVLAAVVLALVTLVATQSGASAPVTPGAASGAEPAASTARVSSASRLVAAARKPKARSKIVRRNSGWTCSGSLERIANRNGRGLPLLVKIKFTRHVNIDPGVIDIQGNCHGDGNSDTIDLILKVQGNGRTKGGTFDAIKVHHRPHDIQITGYANCGPRHPIGHQDGAQIMGGHTIYFVNFRWGKWKKRKATCQGAAGTFAPGRLDTGPYDVRNIRCIRCRSVSCNHGMSINDARGTVVRNSRWRSDNPADRRGRLATGEIGMCPHGGDPCVVLPPATGTSISNNVCDRWPYRRRHH
jgi:hypothetical protein